MFEEAVIPTGALCGTVNGSGSASQWGRMAINRNAPVEMVLAADLQKAAVAHVAGSSCKTYTGQWNMFVAWCYALAVPRVASHCGAENL